MSKRDAKRQAILDIAYRLFRSKGFDATSISEINAEVGGSKATLYSHFPSKEELFVACMMTTAENFLAAVTTQATSQMNLPEGNSESVLRDYGIRFLSFICNPEIVDVQRLMIAEAHRFGIGKLFYTKLTGLRGYVVTLLSQLMESGTLRCEDPQLAAEHLRGLLEAELLEPLLLQVRTDYPDDNEIALVANRAVSAFLRAYAPDTNNQLK
ncbi:MAG: TetR/AcrR family transcriptional regulator [Gammaproteobacteria bacterium]|nr:TetR/AcrR family transcriptional regulator [Gammaproteobacteria bacterium]